MSAIYIRDHITGLSIVDNIRVIDRNFMLITFEEKSKINGLPKLTSLKVFVSAGSEYIIGKEVVDDAIKQGADYIVVAPYSQTTIEGASHAKAMGAKYMKMGEFIGQIQAGHVP
ncbi:hypothetical protein IAD21_02693 [Abditibacteriota bacterium]|nr:hypothetical protein IAD21_02693 [Abditibacteriota bacterium]